jgi:hypothetical protein
MKPCRKSRNDWESRQCKFDIFASSLYININEIKHTTPRTGNVFLGFVCHIHWRLFVISTDDCLSYLLTTVCHIHWRLFVISTDDCLSYLLTTVCHIHWRLFLQLDNTVFWSTQQYFICQTCTYNKPKSQ